MLPEDVTVAILVTTIEETPGTMTAASTGTRNVERILAG